MQLTRRTLLTSTLLTAFGWAQRPQTSLGAISVSGQDAHDHSDHLLVTIFLRGGADGLSLVVPHGDDDYYRARPTLAIDAKQTIDLDGFFGLHPALKPLFPLYASGQMAVIQACGSGDQTRSHFEAMATMERGLNRDLGPSSGWMARHLATAPWSNPSPLRAVALGEILPESLHGATDATALKSISDIRLQGSSIAQTARMEQALHSLYGSQDLLAQAGQETLSVLATLSSVAAKPYKTANGAHYPKDDLGQGLQQVACLAKCGVGLETAALDHGGFDTHIAQGTASGALASRLDTLAKSLAAFAQDLGPNRWAKTTVIVLSELVDVSPKIAARAQIMDAAG